MRAYAMRRIRREVAHVGGDPGAGIIDGRLRLRATSSRRARGAGAPLADAPIAQACGDEGIHQLSAKTLLLADAARTCGALHEASRATKELRPDASAWQRKLARSARERLCVR